MVTIRDTNTLVQTALEFLRAARPQLDTKPGTVARDLLIDGPVTQLARAYEELARNSSAQSLRLTLGIDLDRLASNFGAVRRQGSKATGVALFTFNQIEADIPINRGDIVTANNGASFVVSNSLTISVTNINTYRATASKYRADLDTANISDQYAVEVNVEASVVGTIGNVSKYALSTVSTSGVSNVTNAQAFGGGSQAEDDATFRNRVLAIFSGANTGTSLGYSTAVLSDPSVIDSIVVGPGDDLMTRDGTQVLELEDGTRVIVSEGTGGKVDIYVYGTRLLEVLDTYIYRDQSNQDDPTNEANDRVLGQIEGDENKTVTTRRIQNLEDGILPSQPVNNIIEVSGSSSGPNFQALTIDSLGRESGNYELIRDTGAYGGSPWGFDRLRWTSDHISDLIEDKTKGRFNGQDAMTYADVLAISAVTQEVPVANENSTVNAANRASIQLAHKPVTAVTRVFNLTTGERYVVTSQNPDGEGSVNETGRITISGSTLPAVSDTLQVDYTWLFDFDPNFDFDNRETNTNPRDVIDSIDWGFSNLVRRENSIIAASGSVFTVDVTHPISAVIDVNTFDSDSSTVTLVSNRLSIVVNAPVSNVISVVRVADGAELYATSRNDGSFSGMTVFLPTDTVGEFNDAVTVRFNSEDTFTVDDVSGSFDSTTITLSSQAPVSAGTIVEVNYIANVRTLLPQTLISSLPALRQDNGFQTNIATNVGVQPTTHVFNSITGEILSNLRQAPSRLQLSIAGTISAGTITLSGTSMSGVFDVVIEVANTGLKHNLASLIKDDLGLSSADSVPSTIRVARLISAEKVTTTTSLDVLSIDHTYDIKGYKLFDNSFVKSESIEDSTLTRTEVELPSTADNEANVPQTGDRLRLTFYYTTSSDSENVPFSRSGTLSTQKIFALVDSVAVSSGFISAASQAATLTILSMNQPSSGNRYATTYDYLAPKPNERITIRYNQNAVIRDATLSLETVRPITADVLVKSAIPVAIDVSTYIVVQSAFSTSSEIIRQNVADAITSALNATELETKLDESDIINVCYTVQGVDRVRITQFNLEGEIGKKLTISADKNEYLTANTVTVTVEER